MKILWRVFLWIVAAGILDTHFEMHTLRKSYSANTRLAKEPSCLHLSTWPVFLAEDGRRKTLTPIRSCLMFSVIAHVQDIYFWDSDAKCTSMSHNNLSQRFGRSSCISKEAFLLFISQRETASRKKHRHPSFSLKRQVKTSSLWHLPFER